MYIEISPRTFTSILSDLKMEVAKKGITTDLFAGEQLAQQSCPLVGTPITAMWLKSSCSIWLLRILYTRSHSSWFTFCWLRMVLGFPLDHLPDGIDLSTTDKNAIRILSGTH